MGLVFALLIGFLLAGSAEATMSPACKPIYDRQASLVILQTNHQGETTVRVEANNEALREKMLECAKEVMARNHSFLKSGSEKKKTEKVVRGATRFIWEATFRRQYDE